MNNELIKKVIKINSATCPEFVYDTALLDRNVADALAKSFVEAFNDSCYPKSTITDLRYAILGNIRKICRLTPENHAEDANLIACIKKLYMNKIKHSSNNDAAHCTERGMDAFLITRMKGVNLSSTFKPCISPEVAQALINLYEDSPMVRRVTRDILHWNVSDRKNLTTVKNLWTNDNINENINYDDIALIMKSEIEQSLLTLCQNFLQTFQDLDELFAPYMNVVKKCSISPQHFQMCMEILNYLFLNTNYNDFICMVVHKFISLVKKESVTFATLYPPHLRHIVVLLDIDINVLPNQIITSYLNETLSHLRKLHEGSETDLIMLLSHYPQWLDIYFHVPRST